VLEPPGDRATCPLNCRRSDERVSPLRHVARAHLHLAAFISALFTACFICCNRSSREQRLHHSYAWSSGPGRGTSPVSWRVGAHWLTHHGALGCAVFAPRSQAPAYVSCVVQGQAVLKARQYLTAANGKAHDAACASALCISPDVGATWSLGIRDARCTCMH
jgi:hypothetical protein